MRLFNFLLIILLGNCTGLLNVQKHALYVNNKAIIIIIIIIIITITTTATTTTTIIIIIIIIKIIILARMETFYSSTCICTLLVFEFLISFLNVCIFTDYAK